MALCLLGLVGILLGSLMIQAQGFLPKIPPSQLVNKFPLQPNFQYDQFQGKWYIQAFGKYTALDKIHSQIPLQTITFELNNDKSYNITIVLYRDFTCTDYLYALIPTLKPGLFTFENVTRDEILSTFTVEVIATDYNQFALVWFQMSDDLESSIVYVYGRTKELNPQVIQHCRSVARSHGLPAKFILTHLREECVAK